MAIFTPPSTPDFKRHRFLLKANTQEFRSPLSQSIQTLELTGSRWQATYELPPMQRVDAAQWVAFLARLNGMAGRFYAGDEGGKSPRGSAGGTPLIDGETAGPNTLTSVGITVTSTAHGLVVNDKIKLTSGAQSGEIRKVVTVTDANTVTIDTAFSVDQSTAVTWNKLAAQTGTSLATDGWPVSTNGVLSLWLRVLKSLHVCNHSQPACTLLLSQPCDLGDESVWTLCCVRYK